MFLPLLPLKNPPPLPEELWLQIFHHTQPQDLYFSLRLVSKRFNQIAEEILQSEIIPDFTIALSYSLGSGAHHRWYDIRARFTLHFSSFCKHNPQYALFDKIEILPAGYSASAWEKWNQISASGIGEECPWRLQCGEGAEIKTVRLPKVVLSHKGAWCDWRELLAAYFGPPQDGGRERQWRSR